MNENDNTQSKNTILFDGFDLSVSDEGSAIHSTINPKLQSRLESMQGERNAAVQKSPENDFDAIELQETIGEGGMGIVYSAYQFFPEREVAIKRLKSKQGKMIRGLLDEAMVMGKLSHPNIPPVYRLRMNEDGLPEVIMKKIEGETFQKILSKKPQKGQELKNSLHVLIQVCYAVEFAHSLGFLHRDLKPENIMVGAFNQVYLMDWGLAVDMTNPNRSRQGLAGTPAYMAPEMLLGDPSILTPASDVYLLGTILHEILVGEFRHEGRTVRESLQSVQKSESYVYDDEIPNMLAELCNQSCLENPKDRPQTAVEFRERLESFFEHWEVLKLVGKGHRNFRQYKRLWREERGNTNINFPLLLQISQQAKFSFEQALDIWPDSKEAKKGLADLLEVMIEQALYVKEFHRAIVLFEEYPIENSRLAERLEEAKENWAIEKERQQKLVKIEKELDPNATLAPRFLLQRILMISISFSICFLAWWQLLKDFRLSLEQIFYSILFASLPVWISILIMYSRLMVNSFGRQAVRTIFYGSLGLVFSRYSCWVNEANIAHVAFLDSLVLALVLINSSPAIKNGPMLGIGCFLLAGLSLMVPEYSQNIFNFVALSIGVHISFEWRKSKFLFEDEEI